MGANLPMNQLGMIVGAALSFHHVKAQDISDSDSDSSGPYFLRPNIIVVIGVLSTMFCILLLAYAKFCHITVPDFADLDNHQQNLHGIDGSSPRFSGIDRRVMESIPFFRFSSLKGSKDGLECAVCLSKFEDAEVLRLLPNCRHAFHINCIDQWLESHSSCPLCRYKLDAQEPSNFSYTNSLRFQINPLSIAEDPNFNLFVQREQDDKGKKRQFLTEEPENSDGKYYKLWHKFNHKIIISNVILKNRWSDADSKDLMFLNSEMNKASPSRSFPSSESNISFSMNEQAIIKIEEDVEKKMFHEPKFMRTDRSYSVCNLSLGPRSTCEGSPSRLLNSDLKRSMSEITNLSRFTEWNPKNRIKQIPFRSNNREEGRVRRLWLPIARRTVQWLAGDERNSQESSNI